MTTIKWLEEVHKRKEEMIKDTQAFLQIKSVYDEASKADGAPMGKGVAEALEFLLAKAESAGFEIKNLDGYAGHIQHGTGKGLLGVLCHVDVVPEGGGWTSAPYSAEIRDGKLFARGALDDKGPTMAAFYALKIVKELGLPIEKRVRLIIGTDEESNWQCVQHYFKHEEMPDMGFAPDADFPIIYAEKGIANFFLVREEEEDISLSESYIKLLRFESGLRVNMVPDHAQATLQIEQNQLGEQQAPIIGSFENFIKDKKVVGSTEQLGGKLVLHVEGASAHGSEPAKGVHAGYLLTRFLETLPLIGADQSFILFVNRYLAEDYYGKELGIAERDEMTGPLTVNVGTLTYQRGKESKLGFNLRYPVSTDYKEMINLFEQKVGEFGFHIKDMDNSPSHHVDPNHPLVQTLQRVYEEQTGEEAKLLSIGGGTYARSLAAGVAFGPLFPGKVDTAHQKDEFIKIDDLLQATAIYAQAIYELTSLK
jgi:succinyl-diaminopimelate desuccinylase